MHLSECLVSTPCETLFNQEKKHPQLVLCGKPASSVLSGGSGDFGGETLLCRECANYLRASARWEER